MCTGPYSRHANEILAAMLGWARECPRGRPRMRQQDDVRKVGCEMDQTGTQSCQMTCFGIRGVKISGLVPQCCLVLDVCLVWL